MKKLLLFCALISGTAYASSNFYAQASASETNVFLGQVFNLDVVVKADEKPGVPPTNFNAFNVTTLVDGQNTSETNTWLYRFALRATQEGELTIPSIYFGQAYSKPITIHAQKPIASDRMELRQQTDLKSVYVGEPVLLTTTWDTTYPFRSIKAVDLNFPIFNDTRFQRLELYEPEKEKGAQTTGLPVHGTRVLATRNSYEVDGQQHQALSFSTLLIPKKSGKLIIAPASLLCAAEKENENAPKNRRSAFQYPAYFDNTFFDQNVTGDQWVRIYTESEPLELDVKPLPTENRPPLFNGMVGDYSIAVSAEPTQVRVGEPITLTVKITAEGYMENIFFQPLRYQPNLVNRFEIPSDRSLPLREGKTKTYVQTIRPLSTANTEIPPIQFSFFSPTSNAYVTLESAAIPITVSAAEEIGVFGGAGYQNRLRTVEGGIRHNYENPAMLNSARPPLFGWTHPVYVLMLLLLPPVVVGCIALVSLFGEKKHHIQRTAKAARAFKVFRKNATHIYTRTMKSEIYSDLDKVLRAYLGDRLHLIPGALSYRDAEKQLAAAGADFQTLEELKILFSLCEAYRFTRNYDEQGNARKIVREAVRIVKTVEKSLK
ncbi:BatD family protein [Pontiellaceae bacterium B12219]|nr:BatD family protein [Pontiellaceae bacterium B12219]